LLWEHSAGSVSPLCSAPAAVGGISLALSIAACDCNRTHTHWLWCHANFWGYVSRTNWSQWLIYLSHSSLRNNIIDSSIKMQYAVNCHAPVLRAQLCHELHVHMLPHAQFALHWFNIFL
jgi:hypothetical protein